MTIRDHGWIEPANQLVAVFRSSLLGRVSWPSGRTTDTMLAATVVVSDLEAAISGYGPEQVRGMKKKNAHASIVATAERASRLAAQGWFIRARKRGRQRARRIEALVWL